MHADAAGIDIFGNVCRRSSSGSGGGNGVVGGGGGVVRRAASMLVPVSAIEQAMSGTGGVPCGPGWDRPLPPPTGAITARPTSIVDGMSRSCSALPCGHGLDAVDLDDGGLLLPPSPFRSPDLDDDDDDDASCLDGVLASCGYGGSAPPPTSLPPPTSRDDAAPPATGNGQHRDHRRHLALVGDTGFVWTSLPSPDDVTPTNENQPHAFGPNGRLPGVMPLPTRAPPPSLGDKCPPVRYSDL